MQYTKEDKINRLFFDIHNLANNYIKENFMDSSDEMFINVAVNDILFIMLYSKKSKDKQINMLETIINGLTTFMNMKDKNDNSNN